jgi:glycosyltransferase involved in cell wall biosynthesis
VKVSVAIITYNHEKFIAEALESVLMQVTDFRYEIVIGDDCSSDRTHEIIGDFQKNHPGKIRLLISETNIGVKKNLAQTIMACKGEYIALLDGDDYWTAPQKLRHQVGFLDSRPGCSFCFHSVKRIYEDGRSNFFYPPG